MLALYIARSSKTCTVYIPQVTYSETRNKMETAAETIAGTQ